MTAEQKRTSDTSGAHARVVEALSQRVATGTWREGEMLPGRRTLAREFGVAVNTVNRAIENMIERGALRADDRRGTFVADRARAVMAPDAQAARANAVSDRRASVGVVASYTLERFASNWTVAVIDSLERHVSSFNGQTRFYNVHYPCDRSFPSGREACEAALGDADNDAIVIVSVNAHPDWEAPVLDAACAASIPALCIWYTGMQRAIPHVHMDQFAAGRAAAEHLLESGYEAGLFLAPFEADWLSERIAGAQHAFDAAKARLHVIPPNRKTDTRQMRARQRRRSIAEAIAKGMRAVKVDRSPAGHWGVVCASDHESILVDDLFGERGIRPGVDVGIVGFDDSDDSRARGLSSLRPPLEELGELAAQFTASALRGRSVPTRTGVGPHLHARNSTDRRKERIRT